MSDPRTLLVIATVFGLVLAGTGVAAAGIAGPEHADRDPSGPIHQTATTTTETNATENGSSAIPPGARLSGVVGVQRAELEGEVGARSIGMALNATDSNASRAKVLARESERLEQRLQSLETRLAALEAAHRNGTIPEGAYQAQAAALTARTNALADAVNRTTTAANTLPPDVREQYGVNVTRLGELRSATGNLTGPEVAAIARSIAGPNPGRSGLRGPPAHAGPPSDHGPMSPGGNATETYRTAGPPADRGTDTETRRGSPNGTAQTMGPGTDSSTRVGPNGDPSSGNGPGNGSAPQ